MKYISGPILHPEANMGNDGTDKHPTNFYFGRDVMAFGINYYGGDYKPIQNTPGNQFTNNFQLNSLPTGQPLFNGNISATLLALKGLNNNTTTGYTYLYDQLNRLLNTRQHLFGAASGSYKGNWSQSNTGTTDNYAETFRYDANGNILQLNRNGNSQHPGGLAMDRLNYTYRDGTNQLWSVQDGIAAGAYAGDIDNQGGSNYSYDRIGNLIGDVSENISQVNWTVYGKIGNIQKKQAFLGYVYNAGGERVVKQYLPYATNQCLGCDENTGMVDLEVYERNSNTPNIYKASKTITFLSEYTDVRYRDYSAIIEAGLAQCTPQCNVQPPLNTSDADIYIRDATGNVLAVYHYDRKTSQLRWSEQHLYGSARLGMYLPEKLLTSVSTESKQREVGYLGKQVFELSNHLGNVLATITDKKLQVSLNTTSTAYFEADVQTVQDYYAFGMQMPGRKLSGGYRYGFNGKENDNEVKGEGNSQDYGLRIYSSALGRFLSVDPLSQSYPWYTPYQFSGNNPILFIDRDGAEPERNKKSAGAAEMIGKQIVMQIKSQVKDAYTENEAPIWFWPVKAPDVKGIYSCGFAVGYISDTRGDMAYKLNMYVSTNSKYYVNESNSKEYNNYEGAVTYDIMRSFVTGEGPENYVFPKNGIISSKFLKSDVLKSALGKFLESTNSSYGPTQSEFGITELGKDYLRNGSLFSSITGLVGSAQISFKPAETGVDISIFNVTSLTSGTFGKEVLKVLGNFGIDYTNLYPKSYVRDSNKTTPFGNVSQTFNLFIPYNKEGDKYKKIKDVIANGEYDEE